jgi:hypothetical protein
MFYAPFTEEAISNTAEACLEAVCGVVEACMKHTAIAPAGVLSHLRLFFKQRDTTIGVASAQFAGDI